MRGSPHPWTLLDVIVNTTMRIHGSKPHLKFVKETLMHFKCITSIGNPNQLEVSDSDLWGAAGKDKKCWWDFWSTCLYGPCERAFHIPRSTFHTMEGVLQKYSKDTDKFLQVFRGF